MKLLFTIILLSNFGASAQENSSAKEVVRVMSDFYKGAESHGFINSVKLSVENLHDVKCDEPRVLAEDYILPFPFGNNFKKINKGKKSIPVTSKCVGQEKEVILKTYVKYVPDTSHPFEFIKSAYSVKFL